MGSSSGFFPDRHDVGADSPKSWFGFYQAGDAQESLLNLWFLPLFSEILHDSDWSFDCQQDFKPEPGFFDFID